MNTNDEKLVAEKISAYIDDALSATELESLLSRNELSGHADKTFSEAARYHMMGDALRGELSDASMVDVSGQIHQALQNESFDVVEPVKLVKKPLLSESRFDFFAWLESFARPLAGVAVAASVAVLMVVTVVQVESPMGEAQIASSPVIAPATLVANKPPVNDPSIKPQQMADFDEYLAEHAEFAAQDTLQGRLPYVRAVSYEAE